MLVSATLCLVPTVLCEEMIGRTEAFHAARVALDEATERRGRLLFITGEAGVGKSRLAREIVEYARERGFHILFGRAVEAEVPAPFRPIAGALLSHFRGESLPDAPELSAFRPALGRLLPEWRTSGSGDPDPIVVLAEALIRLLRVVGGSAGCLLVLEDLHWADVETLELLEYFADALGTEPVLCVGTVRAEEASTARELAHKLGAARSATVLDLNPFSPDELDEMACACLQAKVGDEALEFLRAWTDGLPFMVEELLAGAVNMGALVNDGDRWVLDASISPTVPITFADNVRVRLRTLGPDGERILQFAAALGRRFDWSLLPVAAGLPDDVVLSALRGGVAAQLLVAEPGSRFRFRHSLTRDAVLDELLPVERSEFAGHLLQAVQDAHPGLPGEWCEVAAALAETAGQAEQAAALLLELGRRSLAAGALGSAETILRRARASTASGALRAEIDEVALVVLALAGKTDEAIAVGSHLADSIGQLGGSADRRANAHLGVARAAVTAARWDIASSHLDRARNLVVAPDSELAARIQTGVAVVALGRGSRPETVMAEAEKALAIAERLGVHELACEALEVIGRCTRLRDADATEQAFSRALRVAEEHDLALWQARAMAELGTLDLFNCASDERLRRARELALACGAFAIVAHVDLTSGALAIGHFDTDTALLALERSAQLAQTLGMGVLRDIALADSALACAQGGDGNGVTAFFDEVAAGGNDPVALGLAWSARGIFALLTEDRELAHEHLLRADELFATMPIAPPVGTRAMRVLLLAQDRPQDEVMAAARAAAERSGLKVGTICRGYLEAADAVTHGRAGRVAEAEVAFSAAEVALAPADGWRHYAYRMVAPDAVADGWGDPARMLREALAFFEARDLPRVADACRALLRDAGIPVPRRTKAAEGVPEELRAAGITSREAEILTHLAEGLSNQQIAERVFLSARTVERHLANVAAKVGTRTRSELVALAARAGSV
jgi:DNA-binding CsgD family transcriptional regulator/tetratricopeptide (TPR) repeat protein